MTVEEVSNAIKHFLETLEEEKIYKFNAELWNEKKDEIENTAKRLRAFVQSFKKIADSGLDNIDISDEGKIIFLIQNRVWIIASFLEMVKNFLILFIDTERCDKFDSETVMYGRLIKILCKAIGYNKKLRDITFDIFLVDFRNAIFHNKYEFNNDGMTYENYDKKNIFLSFEQIAEKNNEAKAIFDTITSFTNDKTDEIESKLKKL